MVRVEQPALRSEWGRRNCGILQPEKDRHEPEAAAQSVKLLAVTVSISAALASTHTGTWGTGIWSVALEKNRVKELPLMRVKNLANVSLGLKYTMRVKNLAKYAIDESSAS